MSMKYVLELVEKLLWWFDEEITWRLDLVEGRLSSLVWSSLDLV